MDYYPVEPFGEERADMRNALLCKLVDDLHFWLAGSTSPRTALDFMLFSGDAAKSKPEGPPEPKPKGARIDAKLLTNLFLVSAKGDDNAK